jgi:hypothetical protein
MALIRIICPVYFVNIGQQQIDVMGLKIYDGATIYIHP